MSEINYQQLEILSRDQLYNLLKTIIDKSYQSMNNDTELINVFNNKYKINKSLETLEKAELISIIMEFKPNTK